MRPSRKGCSVPFGSASTRPALPFTLSNLGGGTIGCTPDYRTFDVTPFIPAYDDSDDTTLAWFYSTDGSTWNYYEGVSYMASSEELGAFGSGKQWALFWFDLEHPELQTRLSSVIILP